jgi:transmembrane sensor
MIRLVRSDRPPEIERADDEALEWVVRLTSGETTSEEHERFRRWRDRDTLNAEALVRARALWVQLGTAVPEIEQRREKALDRWRRMGRFLPIAASLLLTVGLGHEYLHVWRFDQVTRSGERQTSTLPDGSSVTLAPETALNERYDDKERRIVLARGRAFFTVNHDSSRPFVVETANAQIRDIGTAFDVALPRGGATRIVVAEGVVEAGHDDQQVRLTANRALDVTDGGVGQVRAINAAAETAWTHGRIVISDRPLQEIVAAITPYYPRRIVLLNRAAAERRMSAAIDVDKVDEWLASLESTQAVRLTTLPGLLILN